MTFIFSHFVDKLPLKTVDNIFNAQRLSLKDYSVVFYKLLLFNLMDKHTNDQGNIENNQKGRMDQTNLD